MNVTPYPLEWANAGDDDKPEWRSDNGRFKILMGRNPDNSCYFYALDKYQHLEKEILERHHLQV